MTEKCKRLEKANNGRDSGKASKHLKCILIHKHLFTLTLGPSSVCTQPPLPQTSCIVHLGPCRKSKQTCGKHCKTCLINWQSHSFNFCSWKENNIKSSRQIQSWQKLHYVCYYAWKKCLSIFDRVPNDNERMIKRTGENVYQYSILRYIW